MGGNTLSDKHRVWLAHVEPYAYLRHVSTELPKATTQAEIKALLPWNIVLALIADHKINGIDELLP